MSTLVTPGKTTAPPCPDCGRTPPIVDAEVGHAPESQANAEPPHGDVPPVAPPAAVAALHAAGPPRPPIQPRPQSRDRPAAPELLELTATWEIDRPDFDQIELALDDLRALARCGELRPGDPIRSRGSDWRPADTVRWLKTSFALREHAVSHQLTTIARRHDNRCPRHRRRAVRVCSGCARLLCRSCEEVATDGACARCEIPLLRL